MKRVLIALSITMSISAAMAADNEKRFSPGPASSYETKQSQGNVIVAAVPYVNDDEIRSAFGKANPYKYGILPVLVVIQNGSDKALRLDLKAEYVSATGDHAEAIPARDVAYTRAVKRPKIQQSPIPLPKGKNPLKAWEIEGLAFSAKMLPPGDSVHGFFYFDTRLEPDAKLYLTGLSEAQSGKELFYFEIPLSK